MKKPLRNFNVTRVYEDGSKLSLGTCRSVSEAKLRASIAWGHKKKRAEIMEKLNGVGLRCPHCGSMLPTTEKRKEQIRMLEAALREYSYKRLEIESWGD